MKNRKQKREKLNNAGMTLVEILIAMFILSAAIVPMMYGFVRIARYSAHGRALQQTSGMAQTIMENCKAYSVEDIHNMMNGSGGSFLTGDYATSAVYYVADAPVVTSSPDPAVTPDPAATPLPADDGTYRFCATNIVLDNETYGFELTMTPILQGTDSAMLTHENKNEMLDAVFVESIAERAVTPNVLNFASLKEEAFEDAMGQLSALIESETDAVGEKVEIEEDVLLNQIFHDSSNANYGAVQAKRDIIVNVKNDSGVQKVSVNYKYTFSMPAGAEYTVETLKDATPTSSPEFGDVDVAFAADVVCETGDIEIYNNANTNNASLHPSPLENVYLYYYPAYANRVCTEYPCVSDTIYVYNNSGNEIDLYIMKQKDPSLTSDIYQALAEATYDVQMYVYNGDASIHHNFATTLGDPTTVNANWNESADAHKDALTNPTVTYVGEMVTTEEENLLYSIDVKILKDPSYDNSSKVISGQEVLSLDGTKINW